MDDNDENDDEGNEIVFAGQMKRAKSQMVTRSLKRKPKQNVPQNRQIYHLRKDGSRIYQYQQQVLYDLDGSTSILFGALQHNYNQFFLCLSICIAIIFIYVSITFFGAFDDTSCNDSCNFISIDDEYIEYIANEKLLLLITDNSEANSICNERRLMFSNTDINNSSTTAATTWNVLQSNVGQTSNMYIMLTSTTNRDTCIAEIESEQSNIHSYIELESDEYVWLFSGVIWWQILSVYMSIVFVLYEWLFYSYVEVMVPYKDSRAYFTWYIVRIGLMSFMFSIIVAHSHLIDDGSISLLVGQFSYRWMLANLYSCSIFIVCSMMVCVCCCICQESFLDDSMDVSGRDSIVISSTNAKDYGFSRFFLPHSRIEGRVVNELEQVLATSMVCTVVFIFIFLICGFPPFILFFRRGFDGSVVVPWFASLWFLSMVGMSIQCVWFIRGRICADEEDKQMAAVKDRENEIRSSRAKSSFR